jgi:hypothetical protein
MQVKIMTLLRSLAVILLVIESSILGAKEEIDSRSRNVFSAEDESMSVISFENSSAEVSDFYSETLISDISEVESDYESTDANIIGEYKNFWESDYFVQNQNNLIRWKRASSKKKKKQIKTKKKVPQKISTTPKPTIEQSQKLWIDSTDIDVTEKSVRMHVFIVKETNVPPCNTPADTIT